MNQLRLRYLDTSRAVRTRAQNKSAVWTGSGPNAVLVEAAEMRALWTLECLE